MSEGEGTKELQDRFEGEKRQTPRTAYREQREAQVREEEVASGRQHTLYGARYPSPFSLFLHIGSKQTAGAECFGQNQRLP